MAELLKLFYLGILIGSVLISGCRPAPTDEYINPDAQSPFSQKSGIYADGRCTPITLLAFIQIHAGLASYQLTHDRNELVDAKKACFAFIGLLGDRSCKTKSTLTGELTEISVDSIIPACRQIEKLLNSTPTK